MEIEIFTVCDHAQQEAGKLFLSGTFDVIKARKIPVVHHTLAIALRWRYSTDEVGKHQFTLGINAPDGTPSITPFKGDFESKLKEGIDTATGSMTLLIDQLKLKEFGDYSVYFEIDNTLIQTIPLYVREVVD